MRAVTKGLLNTPGQGDLGQWERHCSCDLLNRLDDGLVDSERRLHRVRWVLKIAEAPMHLADSREGWRQPVA